jgi:multidrug efflux pump subunit AcrA (membrane-fusion protein)
MRKRPGTGCQKGSRTGSCDGGAERNSTAPIEPWNITARTKADIYPSQEGILEDIYVEEGERIEEGQLLAVLSKEKLLLAREQAEAGVESKRSLLSLAEEKLKEGYRSIDARLLSLEKTQAEIDQRRIEFNRLPGVRDQETAL